MAYCIYCGAELRSNQRYCIACGHAVLEEDKTEQYPEPQYQQPQQHKSINLWLIVLLVVSVLSVGAVVVLAGGFLNTKQSSNHEGVASEDTGDTNSPNSTIIQQYEEDKTPTLAWTLNSLGLTSDVSKEFLGVFVGCFSNEADARSLIQELSDINVSSTLVVSDEWEALYDIDATYYYVTVGTWDDQSKAKQAAQALENSGYSNVSVQDTGEYIDGVDAVMLCVETVSGEMLHGIVHKDSNGYVLSDSSTRQYTTSELSDMNLTDAELCIAWNEPFARLGYHFKNPDLRAYFNSCSWYTDTGWSGSLSGVAANNNTTLRNIASHRTYGDAWKSLVSNG